MKKKVILIMLVATLSVSVLVYGKDMKLNITDSIDNATKSSVSLKDIDKQIKDNETGVLNSKSKYFKLKSRLKDDDRMKELANKVDLNELEKQELEQLVDKYGQILTIAEKNKIISEKDTATVETNLDSENLKLDRNKDKIDIKKNVIGSYVNILKQKKQIELQEKINKIFINNYNLLKFKSQFGFTTQIDLKTAYVDMYSDNENLESAKRTFKINIMVFNKIIGNPISTTYDEILDVPYNEALKGINSLKEFKEAAINNRSEIIKIKNTLKSKEREKEVYLSKIENMKYDQKPQNFMDKDEIQRNIDREIMEFEIEDLKLQLEDIKMNIENEIELVYQNYNNKLDYYNSLITNYKDNISKITEIELKQKIGLVSQTELETSLNDSIKIETQKQNTLYDLWESYNLINMSSGIVEEIIKK